MKQCGLGKLLGTDVIKKAYIVTRQNIGRQACTKNVQNYKKIWYIHAKKIVI